MQKLQLKLILGTVDEEKLLEYKNAGINRLSIGLQAVQDRILNLLGRIHDFEQFKNSYELAKKVGFTNINVDLMLAIPTQTEEELIESVQEVIKLNPICYKQGKDLKNENH